MMTGLIVTGLVVAVLVVPYFKGKEIEENNDELAEIYARFIYIGIDEMNFEDYTKHTRNLAFRIHNLGGSHKEYVHMHDTIMGLGYRGIYKTKKEALVIIRDELRKIRG